MSVGVKLILKVLAWNLFGISYVLISHMFILLLSIQKALYMIMVTMNIWTIRIMIEWYQWYIMFSAAERSLMETQHSKSQPLFQPSYSHPNTHRMLKSIDHHRDRQMYCLSLRWSVFFLLILCVLHKIDGISVMLCSRIFLLKESSWIVMRCFIYQASVVMTHSCQLTHSASECQRTFCLSSN